MGSKGHLPKSCGLSTLDGVTLLIALHHVQVGVPLAGEGDDLLAGLCDDVPRYLQ